ncbi:MAG: anaerobic C4-dicarboxylate transporter [Tannerellaceae bacterium]|nr:anaerobic C4-dicarboxylate transporter [Tannerellaceae bacterium]
MLIQLFFVLTAIIIGARIGGIGLGVLGGIGLSILTFGFGLEPTSPPIDVMLMIVAVIAAAACMQAAGGLDLMVKMAEKLLRKNPKQITFLSPMVTYLFTFIAGTGHVAYSVLPVITEVATETKIRPERPLAIAVIASQQAITASPISAATVALLSMLTAAGFNITLMNIFMITVPCTLVGVLAGAVYSLRVGKELADDPEFRRRVAAGEFSNQHYETAGVKNRRSALISVIIFILATVGIVLFGSLENLHPVFLTNGVETQLGMAYIIEILMLSAAALILVVTRTDGMKAAQGSVFSAGMQAVVAIFGIAWMGDTFIAGNMAEIKGSIEGIVTSMPWLFGIALFLMSILLFSQAATIRALLPLGIGLGISPFILIALFPAVNGYFFIPNYPTVVAAINFDRTGTTHIGKYILNHSFMVPGLIATGTSVVLGLILVHLFF